MLKTRKSRFQEAQQREEEGEKEAAATLRNIIIKLLEINDKEKILKAARDFHLQPTQSNSDSTFQDTKATKDSERNHR